MNVRDVMRKRIETVESDDSALDACWTMIRTGEVALPVVDAGFLVGMIAERDLFQRLFQTIQTDFYSLQTSIVGQPEPADVFMDVAGLMVKDLMSTNVVTTRPAETVLKAAATMHARRLRRLPVIEDGQLVGLIYQGDIFARLVWHVAREKAPLPV